MNTETTLNIENAAANFKRDYVNFRGITHDLKFKYLPMLEREGHIFMQRAFKAYAAGKDSAGDVYAKEAEYHFVQAQLLKDFVIDDSRKTIIRSKIAAFNG